MSIKKLTCIILTMTQIIVSCGQKNKKDSRLFDSSPEVGSVRWSFDGVGRLRVPAMDRSDTLDNEPRTEHDFGPTVITPGETRGSGTAEGNCHGGGCASGSDGGLGRDDNGDKGEFSGGSGGDSRWSSGEGSGSGDNKGQPMLFGLLKVPFQLAQAIYDRLDVLSQDLGVVMGDTVGSVFGGSSRRDRSRKAARIRAEMEAERKKLEDEIAKHNETAKWLNEEIAKANEVSLKEIKEVELDHAIKEAQAHVNQLKEQVRTSEKEAEPYVERGQQYNNDLNQAMIEAAKKHNEALDKHMGAMTESLTPIPEMTVGVQPGQALPHTPEGRKIAETRNYLKFVEAEVERSPELRDQKRELVKIADHSLEVASEEFASGNFPAGDFALNLATAALDLALSMTPGIGVGKDIYEGLTGKNLLTGEKLSTFERALSFVSVATGGIAPVVIKASVGIGIMAKIAKRGVKTAEEAEEIVKSGAKAADILDSAKQFAISSDKIADFAESTRLLGGNLSEIGESAATLTKKMDFVFGKATGSVENIQRSTDMLRQMERIGLSDSVASRTVMKENLVKALNDPSSVAKPLEGGRVSRDSLLSGPNGHLKVESIWEGTKLITVKLIGG